MKVMSSIRHRYALRLVPPSGKGGQADAALQMSH